MSSSAVQLCSKALTKLGCRTIQSFADETIEAEMARTIYPLAIDALLLAHPWSFSLRKMNLQVSEEDHSSNSEFVFTLPENVFRVIDIESLDRNHAKNWAVIGKEVHSNAPAVSVLFQIRPADQEFPDFFASATVARLAAELCLPLTENAGRAEYLMKRASAELATARRADAKQSITVKLRSFPLLEARHG